MLPLFLLSCSKESATTINGMPEEKGIKTSSVLPFQVTTVWPDSESSQMFEIQRNAATFLKAKNYDKLDEIAGQLRLSKKCYANGLWSLCYVYAGLELKDTASNEEWENQIAALQAWATAKTNSITARVSLARVLTAYAWKARGGGYAGTVTDKGWQLFGERLNQAKGVLDEAKGLKEKCPVFWTTMMKVALGLQLDKSNFNSIFDKAINFAPDYQAFYMQRARYLMPRWNGNQGELESDLEKSADKIGGEDGDMLYARVVWGIHNEASSENIFKENGFSWERVDHGFKIIEKRFPDSLAAIGEHAYLASYAGNRETAREYLKKTEGKADLAVWYYKEEYIRVANWAFEK